MRPPLLPRFLDVVPRSRRTARNVSIALLHALSFAIVLVLVTEYGYFVPPPVREALDTTGNLLLRFTALAEALRLAFAHDRRRHVSRHRAHFVITLLIALRELQRARFPALATLDTLLPYERTRVPLLLAVAALELVAVATRVVRPARRLSSVPQPASGRPLFAMLLSFPATALLGAGLLMLPRSRAPGADPIRFLDGFFTATSAVCVTGLTVRDTGADFSPFGQAVIASLIQAGGLGIMTFAAFFWLLLGRAAGLHERAAMGEMLSSSALGSVWKLLLFVLGSTLALEVAGALLLVDAWHPPGSRPFLDRFLYSLFQTVSAFCNAGFSLEATSLAAYRGSPRVLLTVMALLVLGGIGFPVHYELVARVYRSLRARLRLWRERRQPLRSIAQGPVIERFSLQAVLVVWISVALLVLGTFAFLFLDRLGSGPARLGLLDAAFLSATARTAGFETFPLRELPPATLLLLMGLMFVGASPASTGGGIKTTTLAVLGAVVRSMWRGRDHVDLRRRSVPGAAVRSAIVILCASFGVVFLATLCLLASHPDIRLQDLLFEAVSAYATVGLSTGVTGELNAFGRLVLCVTMFLGRLGPLSLMVLVARHRRPLQYRFAEEPLAVG